MKRNLLTIAIAVVLLLCSQTIQAKATECKDDGQQTKLDQIELLKQFVGTWERKVGGDTIQIWEVKRYEKAYVTYMYRVIKGKKSFWMAQTIGFLKNMDKFKGFAVYAGGRTNTFISSFTSENKWIGENVQNLNPEKVNSKFEVNLKSPTNFIVTYFTPEGEKKSEFEWHKVK